MKFKLLICLIVLISVAVAAGTIYSSFFQTRSLTSYEQQSLTPDWESINRGQWSPWHKLANGEIEWNPAASFNSFLSNQPEHSKAWKILITEYYDNPDLMDGTVTKSVPGTHEWDLLQFQLERSSTAATVQRVAEAFRRPYLGSGFSISTSKLEHSLLIENGKTDSFWIPNANQNPCLINCHNLYFHKHLDLVYFVSAYARLELLNENIDSFCFLIESILKSAKLVSEPLMALNFTMGIAVHKSGYNTILWALENHTGKFTESSLTELDRILRNESISQDLFENQLVVMHDLVRRLINDKGKIDSKKIADIDNERSLPSNQMDASLSPSVQRALYEMNYFHDLVHSVATKENTEFPINITSEIELRKKMLSVHIYELINAHIPVFDEILKRHLNNIELRDELLLKIAFRRHYLRHGEHAASREDLEAEFMQSP